MQHIGLLGRDWASISAALLSSTMLTIVVTARLMVWLSPRGVENE